MKWRVKGIIAGLANEINDCLANKLGRIWYRVFS